MFKNKLKIGETDDIPSRNQVRFLISKTDILRRKFIIPYLENNNIEFLTYNRRKQYFMLKYILDNKIKHWDNLSLDTIHNLFAQHNKQINFKEIINLPYFNNWLVGFTVAVLPFL